MITKKKVSNLHEHVDVAEAVVALADDGLIVELSRQLDGVRVVLDGLGEVALEDAGVAQIGVGAPLGRPVAARARYAQALRVALDGRLELAEEVVGVAHVAECAALGGRVVGDQR